MSKLLPCPFCGEPAESDSQRHFVNYKGIRGTAVAIYCSQCSCDMTMCYFDFPQHTPEELMVILTEQWNKRSGIETVNDPIGRFERELEKQRMHFFKLQDPRAEGIHNTLAVVHEALKAALCLKTK